MKNELLKGNYGIEKETLRVSKDGYVVSTKHPINEVDTKFKNPHITVDFSEQQVEVITGVNSSIESAIRELELLTNIMYRSMNSNEYLWNYSIPYGSTKKSSMALGDNEDVIYREKLLEKSSYDMQMISGIHFNFSFDEDFTDKKSDKEINDLYFNICKKYAKVAFVIKNMFGMSPTKDFIKMDKISYRQSKNSGYHNNDNDLRCFCASDNYEDYINFINKKISDGVIESFRQVYTSIRMKPFDAKRVEWIEVRNIDLDYTQEYGVSSEKLDFIRKFLLFLAFSESNITNDINTDAQSEFDFKDTIRVLKEMREWMVVEEINIDFISSYINKFLDGKYDAQKQPVLKEIINSQIKIKEDNKKIPLKPIENMELSTQILIEEAYKSGLPVKIISESKNLIQIDRTLIEMATLNPFDSKEGLKIIDSKVKTNKFLKENNFNSTIQNVYKDIDLAIADFKKFENKKIVIKPVNTNFSRGLSVFENKFELKDFIKAIKFSFQFDKEIIIEKFVQGQEYRFLVIDSNVIGVLKRVPANVVGNGINTIRELVTIKNENKLRGEHYKLPLEKIKLGVVEKDYLKSNGLTINFIPGYKEQVFLRKNSNVSTGGDTFDVTVQMNDEYKKIAIKATEKLGLKICGLDIIIPNINIFDNYTILEMNWNPAIHIHTYPLVGENRKPAQAIIEMIRKYQ